MNTLLSQPTLDQTLTEIAGLYDRLLEFRGPKRSGKTTLLDALGSAVQSRQTSRFTRTSKSALEQFQRRVRHGAPLPTPDPFGPEREKDHSNSRQIECLSFFNGGEKTLAIAFPHDPRSLDSQSTALIYREQSQRIFFPVIQPIRAHAGICRDALLDLMADMPRVAGDKADLRDVLRAAFDCACSGNPSRIDDLKTDGLAELLADERLIGATVDRARTRGGYRFRLKGKSLTDTVGSTYLEIIEAVAHDVEREERLDLQPLREVLQNLDDPRIVLTHRDLAKDLHAVWMHQERFDEVAGWMLGQANRTAHNVLFTGNLDVELKPIPPGATSAPQYRHDIDTSGAAILLETSRANEVAKEPNDLRSERLPDMEQIFDGQTYAAESDEATAGQLALESIYGFGSSWPLVVAMAWVVAVIGNAWEAAIFLGCATLVSAVGWLCYVTVRLQNGKDRWLVFTPTQVRLCNAFGQKVATTADLLHVRQSWLGRICDVVCVTVGKNHVRRFSVTQSQRFGAACEFGGEKKQPAKVTNMVHVVAVVAAIGLIVFAVFV
ncbi:MAG: hypothetical protein Q8M16_11545 [Pirellulaceae bacterium]|nr:hypothetical protein [Pirellulaceae bacterium]